jgi:hypothetical protein
MEQLDCPFCKGKSSFIERVKVSNLVQIYQKYLQINISHLFMNMEYIDYLECSKCGLKYFNPLVTGDDILYRDLESKDNYYSRFDNRIEFVY